MTVVNQKIDKSKWPAGPCHTEPDRVEFEHAGLPCLMVRQSQSGHWCGYAAVPPGHPLHGKDDSESGLDVHGGPTYAQECSGSVCHVPKPGEPDNVWWFGFDCAHYMDLSPGRSRDWPFEGETYKTAEWVRAETQRLAEQLAALAKQAGGAAADPARGAP